MNMIKDYPKRKMDYDDLHEQTVTASITGMTGCGSASRKTESTALRQLPAQEQREYDAVHQAVLRTKQMPDGLCRYRTVNLTLIKKRYTIPGAAIRLGISEDMAKQYRWEFIVLVGHLYGFLSKEEYTEVIRKKKKTSPPKAK